MDIIYFTNGKQRVANLLYHEMTVTFSISEVTASRFSFRTYRVLFGFGQRFYNSIITVLKQLFIAPNKLLVEIQSSSNQQFD